MPREVTKESSQERRSLSTLARIRLLAGLRQVDLARKAGLSIETVSTIERGIHEPRASTARALARALDYPVTDLFPEVFRTRNESNTGSEVAQ